MDEPVTFRVKWLTPVSDAMFTAGSVQTVYGRLEGAADNLVAFQYMTDYKEAAKAEGFAEKIGSWSVTETFDYPNVGSGKKVQFSAMKLTPKLIYSGSAGMLVENVGNYGFRYGIYPEPNGGGKNVVFAAPDLKFFQVRNVAYTSDNGSNDISNNNSFTFETSADGENWTAFTGFTKGDILPGTGTKDGIWAQRDYTSNEDAVFPEGTNYLRVNYPGSETWRFNMTQIILKGGDESQAADAVLAGFALGGHTGVIDQDTKTVSLPVPASMDITAVTPEITVTPGASISPEGPQDFTEPVTYTVTNGSVQAVSNFIRKGGSVLTPASPSREGYLFGGWTTDRSDKEAMQVEEMKFEEDTVFYAIWNKDPRIVVRANADASGKTWQKEKVTNYGADASLLLRQHSNTAEYGMFGEKFTSESTTDGTDMKASFIRFDVSEFQDQAVQSVKLALHYEGNQNGGGTTDNVKLLATTASSDWDESKVTWVTRPALTDPDTIVESEAFTATQNGSKTLELDVTDFYEALSEGEEQITFAVTVNTNARDFRLTSKEGGIGSNAANAPMLFVEVEKDPDYMVTYDLNGGTGTAPIQSTLDASQTFTAAKGTGITGPDGRLFAEWNTKADGTGISYRAGDTVTMPAADLTLYAIYKVPVTITPKQTETVEISGNQIDLSRLGLFDVDTNAGKNQVYSVVSGGTGKGRVDKTDGKTLTVSRFGSIRIKLATSETDTHMAGEAVAALSVKWVGSMQLSAAKTELLPNETVKAVVSVTPSGTVNTAASWSSSDESVARVDQKGTITAVAKGSAQITAVLSENPEITASIRITVSDSTDSDEILRQRIAELQAEMERLKDAPDQLAELQAQIVKLQKEAEKIEGLEDRVNQLSELESEIAKLQGEISRIDILEDKAEKITELEAQIKLLQEEAAKLEDVQANTDEIERLNGEIAKLQDEISKMETLEDKVAEIETLKGQIQDLREQADAVAGLDLEEKLSAIAGLEEQMAALQGEVDALPEGIDGFDGRIGKLESDLKDLIDQAGQIPDDLATDIDTLKTDVNTLKGQAEQVEALKTEVEKISGLQTQINLLKEQAEKISELQREVAKIGTLEEQIASLTEQVNKIASLEAEIKRLEGQAKELAETKAEAERVAKLEAELLKMKQEKEEAQAAIRKIQEELLKLQGAVNAKAEAKDEGLKAGDTITTGNVKYRVISAAKKTAEAYGVKSKNLQKVAVAPAVKIKGVTLKVTAVADSAFKGMTKLKKATVGRNVVSIGKRAFYGDKNLKNIVLKGRNLKKVGASALKNISAKAVIKAPKGMKGIYTKAFQGKGQKKTVTVK